MKTIEAGNVEAAMVIHNKHVDEQFEKAKRGEVINLSDLMAAKEQIDLKIPLLIELSFEVKVPKPWSSYIQ